LVKKTGLAPDYVLAVGAAGRSAASHPAAQPKQKVS